MRSKLDKFPDTWSKKTVNLSHTERWILANQYRILSLLDPDNKTAHERAVYILEEGFEAEYSVISQHITSETLSKAETAEVYDILDMYRAMQRSYKDLGEPSSIRKEDLFLLDLTHIEIGLKSPMYVTS